MLPTIGFVLVLTCTTIFNVFPTKADELKTYVVHLHSHQVQDYSRPYDLEQWYKSLLSESSSGSNEKPRMIYMYHHVIKGFAAKMSVEQAKTMQSMKGVVSVRPESVFRLHTTRSPHFLGLHQNSGVWRDSNYGKGIIIGLLDSGITPGHPSFNDEGMPPPPARWKGKCMLEGCNNKLIGLRAFSQGDTTVTTPFDIVGHGTHTSSTAAGSPIDNANVIGNANGTATGMAPLAHLAMYQVCGFVFCVGSDILAGMDAAIGDGVDVLSISLGGPSIPFYNDSLAIGTFTAVQKGIFVSCSAGNKGPLKASVSNGAPWMLTVGASTIDRRIRTSVHLGNNQSFDGESLYQPNDFDHMLRPLVYPGIYGSNAALCLEGSLHHFDVKGKVVLCDLGEETTDIIDQSIVVKKAGGAALIIANGINGSLCGETTLAEAYTLPASHVGYKEAVEIKKYLNSASSPVATILFHGTILGIKSAPEVGSFSSRGPNNASLGILKPDIIGPGINILAAWPTSVDHSTGTKATYQVDSGTSMSCPHLAGIAALLKSAHPDWSPAAIKSAIMTTATQVSLNGHPIVDEREIPADVLAIGSGHVNPSEANDPGLVFDIQPDDYIPYLCGLGYTPEQIGMIIQKNVACSTIIPEAELNYPSFAVVLTRGDSKTHSRTVTNVGKANSTYTIGDISAPQGVRVTIDSPSQELRYTALHQKLTYKITFNRDVDDEEKDPYGQGHMTWVSGSYSVRTPFSFKFE